jgi:Leucine-rich repeat (LRR) protein
MLESLTIEHSLVPKFSHHVMPKLNSLRLVFNGVSEFVNNTLPSVTHIYLNNNTLSNIDCSGFKSVEVIDLSCNLLSDNIADTLIDCRFPALSYLNLTFNRFDNISFVKNRLKISYPNTSIYL